jgi:hypothetical protein
MTTLYKGPTKNNEITETCTHMIHIERDYALR